MCQTSAVGISSQTPSTIPNPARKMGTRPTFSVSSAPVARAIGVSSSIDRVRKSRVAS
jgi:hypothetical protein